MKFAAARLAAWEGKKIEITVTFLQISRKP